MKSKDYGDTLNKINVYKILPELIMESESERKADATENLLNSESYDKIKIWILDLESFNEILKLVNDPFNNVIN